MTIQNKIIWVVDDDIAILEAIEAVLKEEGHQVVIINDPGTIADKITTEQLPHLVFLDILMSGTDGRDIVRHLKNEARTKHIPIIMISADMRIEEITKKVAADGYLKKPFDIEDLIRIVDDFTK